MKLSIAIVNYHLPVVSQKFNVLFGILLILIISSANTVFAQKESAFIRQVRVIEPGALNSFNPIGLAFSPRTDSFLVLQRATTKKTTDNVSTLTIINHLGDVVGSSSVDTPLGDTINLVFDGIANRLFLLRTVDKNIIEVDAKIDELPNLFPTNSFSLNRLDIKNPQGMTIDPDNGDLIILDSAEPRILRIERKTVQDGDDTSIVELGLKKTGLTELRGIAVNPENDHFYLLSPPEKRLYEVTDSGVVVANLDLSDTQLIDPQGMSFAPSGDLTDDSSHMSLYIADNGGGGQIVELSLTQTTQQATTEQGTLVQTIDTSLFSPPSPDPAGITYHSALGTLMASDSEVEEMPIFADANLFEMTLVGSLVDTFDITIGPLNPIGFSDEPAGIAFNPSNGHLFFADDDDRMVFELDPGNDGILFTNDDSVTSFDTRDFSSNDPEGIAYDTVAGAVFIVDGINSEVYRIDPGINGIFDGVAPAGDDQATHFDTEVLGITDPEGITFDSDSGNLYIVGKPDTSLAHISTSGSLIRMIDISVADASKPAGLAYAPGSFNASVMNVYISDRGDDNDSVPNENDGKVYEISVPSMTSGNTPPVVNAGPDQTITLPEAVVLDATVTDDGLPSGALTIEWSQINGPGVVTFADSSSEDTTASFSVAGLYGLQLTADDGELVTTDDVIVEVTGGNGEIIVELRISTSSDDAEERASGSVSLTSSDLELVQDGGGAQTVGLCFAGVNVPNAASVLNAYIQFQVDESNTGSTSLIIHGEATDNAATFNSSAGNISSRPTTAAQVSWIPAPWQTIGDAGIDQRTPDITSIVQEIVNYPGWSNGNRLAIIINGSGERVAEAFNGVAAGAPLLHVEFLPPNGQPPTVTITAPPDGTTIDEGDSITFTGTAIDLEDGDLSAGIQWTSNLSTVIGAGASFTTTSLSPGTHAITALVTDNDGLQGSEQITVTVNSTGNTAPMVAIFVPVDGSTFAESTPIEFIATATDNEDGDIAASLSWTSNIDGLLGTGGSLTGVVLTVGPHSITASVTDLGGLTASDSIAITITEAGANLVGNPSFETDTSGWEGYRGATIQRVPGGLDGAFSLEVAGPSTKAKFGVNDTPTWIAATVAAGTRYRFTAWAKSDVSIGSVYIQVREYANGTRVGPTTRSPLIPLSTSWQMITVDRVSQTAGSLLDLQIIDKPVANGELFQLDAISIQIIP